MSSAQFRRNQINFFIGAVEHDRHQMRCKNVWVHVGAGAIMLCAPEQELRCLPQGHGSVVRCQLAKQC